jgi:MerR family transcriptional regulator, light-induced transcriptional regulator
MGNTRSLTFVAAAFPIAAVSRLTGIPLETLRAWERRYGAVSPKRTARGRIYSERHVRRLTLLRRAVDTGHAIGQVARIDDSNLQKLLDRSERLSQSSLSSPQSDPRGMLAPILHAIDRYDYSQADRELNRVTASLASPKGLVYEVALPLMRIVGERWHEGRCSVAQEHMLTCLLSALLSSLTRIYIPSSPSVKVLFATPREEHHGFPNLAAALLAAVGGLGVVHLGTNLPGLDIVQAARRTSASALLLSVSRTPDSQTRDDLLLIARKVPKSTELWLGGSSDCSLAPFAVGSRWKVFQNFHTLERELAGLGGRF